jgi:hypothetical protein
MQTGHALWVAILASLVWLVGTSQSFPRGEWPDGPMKEWFRNLKRPDGWKNPHWDEKSRSCCDVADTVKTKFKVEPLGSGPYPEDVWYAWLNEKWVRIPPEKIVNEYAPNGEPYLFVIGGTIQCFVRPKGGI